MQSERLLRSGNIKSQSQSYYGGDGRYFYILCNGTTPNKVSVIDSTLLTSGNYLGGGLWTTNPEVAAITLSAGVCHSCLYVPTKKEVWVFGTGIKIIDANPSSPSWNTELSSFGVVITGISNGAICVWEAQTSTIVVTSGQVISQFLDTGELVKTTSKSGVQSNVIGKYVARLNLIILGDNGTFGLTYVEARNIVQDYGICVKNIIPNGAGRNAIWASDKYVYHLDNGTIRVYDDNAELVTSVVVTAARAIRPGFSEKNLRLLSGNLFSNSLSFFEESTLLGGGNVTKGYIHADESGSREILCKEDIGVVIPSATFLPSNTLTYVHAIDVAGKTYIGYVPLTATLGDYTLNSYNGHLMCKTRAEI